MEKRKNLGDKKISKKRKFKKPVKVKVARDLTFIERLFTLM